MLINDLHNNDFVEEFCMNYNESLGIKSLAQANKKQLGEKLKEQFALAWIFDKWYEKLILVILGALGLWKVWSFIA